METSEQCKIMYVKPPKKKIDLYAKYDRNNELFNVLPMNMIILGKQRSGKSTLVRKILDNEDEFNFEYDNVLYHDTYTKPFFLDKSRLRKENHNIVVFDDAPLTSNKELSEEIDKLFKSGRHIGASSIVVIHSVDELMALKNANLANIFVMAGNSIPSYISNIRKIQNKIGEHNLINELNGNARFNYKIIGSDMIHMYDVLKK